MHPIATVARFEFRYQTRQPAFYLFAALSFGQGVWYPFQLATRYDYSDAVLTAYLTMASLGVVVATVAVLLAAQSLTKDLEYRTTAYMYAYPISSRVHFAGRFLGTYVTALLLATGYPLGIGFYALVFTPNELLPWLALLDGFVRLVGQNIFIVVSVTFSLTALLRSVRGAYVSLFLIVLYFLLTESNTSAAAPTDFWQLLDPFGVSMARDSVESQALAGVLEGFLVYSDLLLINRILWLGLAMGLLAYAEANFSFAHFSTEKSPNRRLNASAQVENVLPRPMPTVQPQFGGWQWVQTMGRFTNLTLLQLLRQPVFLLTAGLLVVLSILSITVLALNPDFPELPTTAHMTALRLSVGYLISLFLLVLTTEVLFQERTVGFWPIYDALPQSNLLFLGAKLGALIGVATLLTTTLFLAGLGLQLSKGFTEINGALYAADLVLDGLLRYVQLIFLGALVASLVNDRLSSHLINLVLFTSLTIGYQLVHQPSTWLYSFLPGSAAYSDLIGYGIYSAVRPLFQCLWWSVAGVLLTSFLLTWNRGVVTHLPERLHQWRVRFRWPYQVAFVLFSLLIGVSLWQTQRHLATRSIPSAVLYKTRTERVSSAIGKPILVQIRYHHPYQVAHMLRAVRSAMATGETLFGPYPFARLQVVETPTVGADVFSKPAYIALNERHGWIADNHQPEKLDYIDYLITREVLKQWLVHRLQPKSQPGNGFVRQSLAEYLALQQVRKQYGTNRLKERLTQRATWYANRYRQRLTPEPSLLQTSGDDAVERGRGALVLTSIEQVWGDKPLSFTIGQFYKKAIQQPSSATATAFAAELASRLPDSLAYLPSYLREPIWFDCRIGRLAKLPNGLAVEIIPLKWREEKKGQWQPIPFNDYLPLAVIDQQERIVYRQLIHPDPSNPFVRLPTMPAGVRVVIDPLGAWPERNKRDNAKWL